ncbi:MAG: hypothetical protein K6T17_07960 [Fimbriimonadales bacterium]|nr:hypothetical protein [Fimbriimonadales bacterium]
MRILAWISALAIAAVMLYGCPPAEEKAPEVQPPAAQPTPSDGKTTTPETGGTTGTGTETGTGGATGTGGGTGTGG